MTRTLATVTLKLVRWLLTATCMAGLGSLGGCRFDSAGPGGAAAEHTVGAADTSAGQASGSTGQTGHTDTGEGSGSDDSTQGSNDSSGSGGGGTSGTPPQGCPEPLPAGWIFCEDFEAADALEHLSTFDGAGGRMAVEVGPAHSGSAALRIRHTPDQNWAGRAAVDFGQGPGSAVRYAPSEQFSQVWVRAMVRTEPGWPDRGPGDLFDVGIVSTAGTNPIVAATAAVWAGDGATVLGLHLRNCLTDGVPGCDAPQNLGGVLGQAPLYSMEMSGTWQCVVLRARLDDGRTANGGVQLRVNDRLDAERAGLEFVGAWAEYRWNRLTVSASWDAAPETELVRWVDDLVVSAVELSCAS